VKIKKEKAAAPVLSSVHVDGSGRQLRGRKAAQSYVDRGSDDEKASLRAESRTSRRQTIANFATSAAEPPPPSRSVSRRMSIASSVSSIGDSRSVSRAPSVAASRRSVAPSTTSSNGVPMKKARGTAAAARAPQRPPVPRIPSGYSVRSSLPKGKENDDLDRLASGMGQITLGIPSSEEHGVREKAAEAPKKRITLKMPSKEEHDAREKAKAASRKATSKHLRIPPGTTLS
jgi:histone deacetylase HOS3